MTFEEFTTERVRLQTGYIVEQREKMIRLDQIRAEHGQASAPFGAYSRAYTEAARGLGFHPHSDEEIQERLAELDRMEATVNRTHGFENPNARIMYDLHNAR